MSINSLLHVEIENEFEKLDKMEVGSEKHKTTVEGLVKLLDKAIEIEKSDIERAERIENQKLDNDFKQKQMDEERKDRLIKNCLTLASIVIPSVITVWGTIKTIKFEEEGTITTIMGRGFINKLLPKK